MAAKRKPGPEAERLVIEGDWKEVIGKAMLKKRPAPDKVKPVKKPRKPRA